MGIVAAICAGCLPLTALVVGLICKGILGRALSHIEETQTVGGTPKNVYLDRAELEAEKRRQALEAKKPKPVRRHGVIS